MLLCYVDESGNGQLLDCRDAPPVLVLGGIVVAEARLKDLAWDFLKLKKQFNPQLARVQLSSLITTEVKGSDLRSDIRTGTRRARRRAVGFVDDVLSLVEGANATVVAEVRVKKDGEGIPESWYAHAIACLAENFQSQLAAAATTGLMILDARTKVKNTPSVHGVTTRKFRSGGDGLSNIVESPVFGHSDSHVALQVVDILVSTTIFPMACAAYCRDLNENVHAGDALRAYELVRDRWGQRIRGLEDRYLDAAGSYRGGVRVYDRRNHRPTLELFQGELPPLRPRTLRSRLRTRGGVPIDSSSGAGSEPQDDADGATA